MYRFVPKSIPIKLNFEITCFNGFCGAKIIVNCYPDKSCRPVDVFKSFIKTPHTSYKMLSNTDKEDVIEKYFDAVSAAMKEFTDYISRDGDWMKMDKSATAGIFRVGWEYTVAGEKHEISSKVDLYSAGLQRALIFISDAINGEGNNPIHMSPYNLAMSSPKWRPVTPFGVRNPNTYRITNVWSLEVLPDQLPYPDEVNFVEFSEYEEYIQKVIQTGETQ